MIYSEKIELIYTAFRDYPVRGNFCTFCYDSEEIEYYETTAVRDIVLAKGRKLLWETGDHWESPEVLKHYLPRILEIMFPPFLEEELYPGHILQTLKYNDFHAWSELEQSAVLSLFADAKEHFNGYDEEDWYDWGKGILLLTEQPKRLK